MNYISQHDQLKHSSIVMAINMERKEIARRYRLIKQLQERLLKVGTKEEQANKRLKVSSIMAS